MTMDISFFIRSKQKGISIRKHFTPLIEEIGKTESVMTYYLPEAHFSIKGIVKNLLYTYKHRNKKGINHITGDCNYIIFALFGCKTVLTVHDLGFYNPKAHGVSKIKNCLLYYLQIYWPIKIADKVIAITEKTKGEILNVVPYSRNIDIARHISVDAFPYTPKELDKKNVRIFQSGTGPQKNLETTIKAVASLHLKMVIIRRMTEEQIQLAKEVGLNYDNLFDLTDEEMTREYQRADIVCMPSLYEGFGAMVIESQATGRPVITTDKEPMKSVSGGAACLLKEPKDVEALKSAILKIINDDYYRKNLIKEGLKNAEKYLLKNCALDHLSIYKSLE